MTIWNGVRPLRIEIHGQPERQRYWAEVELVSQHSGARRVMLESPAADGVPGMLVKVAAQLAEWEPRHEKPAPPPPPPPPVDEVEHDEEHDDQTDEPEGEASPDQPPRRRRGRPPKVRVEE